MKIRTPLTAERARELFTYDPLTGELRWAVAKQYKRAAGDIVGWVNRASGRPNYYVSADGKTFLVHRVIWLFMTGEWPAHEIDHINGDPLDNRWANLRDVPGAINAQNMRTSRKGSRVGLLGVYMSKCISHPYVANITINGKKRHLGYFATAEEAHAVYLAAKRQLHVGCTI